MEYTHLLSVFEGCKPIDEEFIRCYTQFNNDNECGDDIKSMILPFTEKRFLAINLMHKICGNKLRSNSPFYYTSHGLQAATLMNEFVTQSDPEKDWMVCCELLFSIMALPEEYKNRWTLWDDVKIIFGEEVFHLLERIKPMKLYGDSDVSMIKWEERKKSEIDRARHLDADALCVEACDELQGMLYLMIRLEMPDVMYSATQILDSINAPLKCKMLYWEKYFNVVRKNPNIPKVFKEVIESHVAEAKKLFSRYYSKSY